MNVIFKLFACVAASVVVFSSCTPETPTPPEEDNTVPASAIAKINALGFDTLNVAKASGGYIVEGDIFLTDRDLETQRGYTTLFIGEADQYKFSYTLNALPRVINVSAAGLPEAYVTATDAAVARFNALNLRVTFKRVVSTADADIQLRDSALGNAALALTPAYPAVSRNPSSPVLLNVKSLGNAPDVNRLATLVAHELGHAIGLRHTTYVNNPYNCTYSQVNKTANSQLDLIPVEGTPTTGPAYSWLAGCVGNEDHPFNPNDVVALNYFYGNTPGVFNVPTAAYRKGTKELHLFLRSKTNTLLERTYVPGTGWSAWQDLGGTLTSDPSATSRDENRLDVFARGANSNLIFRSWTKGNGWGPWQDLGGNLFSAPNAESRAADFINVLVKGANDALQTIYYVEGEGWHEWQTFNVRVASVASGTSRYPNSIEMYALGYNNNMVQGIWTREKDRTDWGSLGGNILSAPSAIARGYLAVDVFALGANHHLITTNWSAAAGWNNWESIGANIYSAPTTASTDSLSMDIFVKGPSDNLLQRTWTKASGYGPWINLQ